MITGAAHLEAAASEDDPHGARGLLAQEGIVMTIAPTLQKHLARKHIEYDLVPHPPTMSSIPTARACYVPAYLLAKGVVLRTREGYVLAVLPASHRLRRADLKGQFGEDFALATEHELDQLFRDCAHGAVPPVGECYGLDVVVEDSIREQPDIYFEGGDHTTVAQMCRAQFARLTADARLRRTGTGRPVHVDRPLAQRQRR
jgi:Ala-tRNA(Pro) deacylase